MADIDRNTPPPADLDALPWWERREIAEAHSESAQALSQRAKTDPDQAPTLLAQAQVQALLAVYHEIRAASEHHEQLLARAEQTTEVINGHIEAMEHHAGAVADHTAALGNHGRAMTDLRKAISNHGADLRDALSRREY